MAGDTGALEARLGGVEVGGIEASAQSLDEDLARPAGRRQRAQARWGVGY